MHPVVEALLALRGVQFTVAVTMAAERGDLMRFATPRALMKFLGLTPSEYSTGEGVAMGPLPKRAIRMRVAHSFQPHASPAAGSRSEARAEAGGKQVHALVRP